MKQVMAVLLLAGVAAQASATRVVTLAPNLAELVCAAGGCDQLVGVSAYSDAPVAVAKLPTIGDAFGINLERLLALRPDLVLAWRGGTSTEQIERIRKLGLKVETPGADGLDGVAVALTQIGALLGTAPVADQAVADYRARIESLRARWRDAKKLRVVFEIGTQPFYTVSDKSPIGDAIRVCGGSNVFGDLSEVATVVTPESIVAAAPEVVIYGSDESVAEVQRFWSRLAAVPAVRNGAIFAIDANRLNRATPRMADGVESLCKAIDRAR